MNDQYENFHVGFVALVGRPNVGKSSLLNQILGQKIAAVSPKPQTTRRQQLGILTTDEMQIVFMDTPGLHIARHKLGDAMNQVAEYALTDADVIVWIVDGSESVTEEDRLIAERINGLRQSPPVLMLLNKSDLLDQATLEKRRNAFQALNPQAEIFTISATLGSGVPGVMDTIKGYLPVGHPFYDPDQITDYYERDIAIELIREAVLLHLEQEVPHAVAVRLDEYQDREDDKAYIAATLFVERDSQKGIVIGKKGSKIRQIGMTARKEIEALTGRQVFLDLRVKVQKNWRNNPDALRMMGYGAQEE